MRERKVNNHQSQPNFDNKCQIVLHVSALHVHYQVHILIEILRKLCITQVLDNGHVRPKHVARSNIK
jgi:hypothetical protein